MGRSQIIPSLRSSGRLFGLLYLIAVVVRLAAAMSIGLRSEPDRDETEYMTPAINIVRGVGYALPPQGQPDNPDHLPTAFRMPGPAMLMAGIVWFFGEDILNLRLAAILFSSLSVPLMYLYCQQVLTHQQPDDERLIHRIAFIAALVCAVYPLWVYHSLTRKSEPYFVPFLLLSHILVARHCRRHTRKSGLFAGVTWGILTYVKPYGFPMTLLGTVHFWLLNKCRKILPSVLMLAGFLFILSPWVIRNYLVFDRFILMATEGSETFLGCNNPYVFNNPENHGKWLSPMEIAEYRAALAPYPDELDRRRIRMEIATNYLRENPHVIPWLAFWKLKKFYSFVSGSGWMTTLIVLMTWGVSFSLFLLGLLRRSFRFTAELQLVLMWFFMQTVVTAVYSSGYTRGRLPVEILLIPWALLSAQQVVQYVRSRGVTSAPK